VNGTETSIWKSAWTQKVGTHRAEVCTDVDNVILESDEKNNCASIIFEIKRPEEKGDLTVEQLLIIPAQPRVGERVLFSARIRNLSSTKSGGSYAHLRVDNILLGTQRIPGVFGGAFEEVEWNGNWRAIAGSHTYKICADGKKEVLETNEENNCSSDIVIVTE